MIFLAGSLDVNGGSTFLLRLARKVAATKRLDIIVLTNVIDPQIRADLEQVANIFVLHDLVSNVMSRSGTGQFAIFMPIDTDKLERLLQQNQRSVHAMGVFGLIYAFRLANRLGNVKISAGVYHQHEYVSPGRNFFVTQSSRMFGSLPAENVVFFNEFSRTQYTRRFKKDYTKSPLLPIGIDLPDVPDHTERPVEAMKLVSVGNLNDFKTYNEHVIRTVAELLPAYPQLRYDVYGDGERRQFLEQLIVELNLTGVVQLHGRIPYDQVQSAVANAVCFIGSGTALLEAAALQVPAIPGIESIKTPQTYGFLCDLPGLSYHELMPGLELHPIRDVIRGLLALDQEQRRALGKRCADKAAEFSIDRTLAGFESLTLTARSISVKFSAMFRVAFFASFVWLGVMDKFHIDRKFRNRRDQLIEP